MSPAQSSQTHRRQAEACGGTRDYRAKATTPVASSGAIVSDDLLGRSAEIGGDKGLLAGRIQDHAGARDEGGRAAGAHGPGRVPGVRRDQPHFAGSR